MNSDAKRAGYGPDDMGDDEQDTEVAEYKQYIENPPDDLLITEDDDRDAEQAADWAARHPRAAASPAEPDDNPAEQAAMHETRGELLLHATSLLASNEGGGAPGTSGGTREHL